MTGTPVVEILRRLERYYEASAEDVSSYLRPADDAEGREALLVREDGESVELALVLPTAVASTPWPELTLDQRCQVIEGASHFLVVCERARTERPTTHLELELQAEVDKWLILSEGGRLDGEGDAELRDALYEDQRFLHDAASMEGERYRLANALAARFVHRLSGAYARRGRHREMRSQLRRFFHMGQEEKIRAIAA